MFLFNNICVVAILDNDRYFRLETSDILSQTTEAFHVSFSNVLRRVSAAPVIKIKPEYDDSLRRAN